MINKIELKEFIVNNYRKKLEKWLSECDKSDINDLDEFDLKNIAKDFNININDYVYFIKK